MKRQLASLLFAISILGTNSALAQPTVVGYELVSSTRIGRTLFEYTYRVRVTNNDAALLNARGQAISSSPLVTMVDGQAQFGNIAAGAVALSTDTITLRQDRSGAIDTSVLRWTFVSDAPPPVVEGALLPGDAASPASAATVDYFLGRGVLGQTVFEPEPGVLRTRARVVLRMQPSATVAQVNGALSGLGARIVRMRAGSPWLGVELPPVSQNDASVVALSGSGMFDMVHFALIAQPTTEQVNGIVGTARFRHHLAVRGGVGPAVAAVLANRPANPPVTLLFIDDFGRGEPLLAGLNVEPSDYADYTTSCRASPTRDAVHRAGHGYYVLSVAAGSTEEAAGLADVGPRVRVRAVDIHAPGGTNDPAGICRLHPEDDVYELVYRRINEELRNGRRVVISSSVTSRRAGVAEREAILNALGGLAPGHPQLIWAASAGNSAPNTVAVGLMRDSLRTVMTESGSGFIVEARNLSETLESGRARYGVGCRRENSFQGTIGAIGSDVQAAFRAAQLSPNSTQSEVVAGTSVATPQVAALAYLMWVLRPAVSADVIEAWINSTARPSPSQGACLPSSNVIDVLSALLATENVPRIEDASPVTLPLRSALLLHSRTADSLYNGGDLREFRLDAESQGRYSEADLNRDGAAQHLMSFPQRDRFDLMPVTTSTVALPVFNQAPTFYGFGPFSINENSVSDLDVLCYYAHVPGFYSMLTPLDTSERESLGCGPPAPTSTSRPNTLANANLGVGKPLVPTQLQGLCGETHPLMGCMLINNSLKPNDPLIGSNEPNLGYWAQGAARAAPIALYQHFEIHPRGQVPTPLPVPPQGFPPDSPGAARARAASYRAAAWVLSDIWTNPGRVDGYMRTGWRGFANADIEAAGLAATGSSDAVYTQTLTIAQRSTFTATIKVTRTAMVGQMCAPRVVGERPNRAWLGVAFWRRAGGSRVPATGLTPSGESRAAGRFVTFCNSDSTVPPQEVCGASQLGPYFCDTTGTAPDEFTITGVIEPGTYEVIAESAGEFRTHDTIEAIADATISVVYSPLP